MLVDLLLALLARPGGALPVAPLRDAAELLWRQCCQALGKEGLEDVVRVVAAGDKGAGQGEGRAAGRVVNNRNQRGCFSACSLWC